MLEEMEENKEDRQTLVVRHSVSLEGTRGLTSVEVDVTRHTEVQALRNLTDFLDYGLMKKNRNTERLFTEVVRAEASL